jgi:hypothetical protein
LVAQLCWRDQHDSPVEWSLLAESEAPGNRGCEQPMTLDTTRTISSSGGISSGVRMVQTSHIEEFLKVLIRLPCLALEVMLSGRNIHLIGAVRFLVIIVGVGSCCDPLGGRLCPFLLPLSPFLVPLPLALDGAPSCYRGPFSHRLEQRWPQLPLLLKHVGW